MLQLWKARQGRKAAVAALAPFVAQSRCRTGGIPERVWHDAYVLGFLSMLASLHAWKAVGPVGSHALGLIQAGVMAELSGEPEDLLGEEICLLDLEHDRDFADGCRCATLFHEAMQKAAVDRMVAGQDWPLLDTGGSELAVLWRETFEARVTELC